MTRSFPLALVAALLLARPSAADDWKHRGTLWLLTDADGANLPAAASVTDFPVLLRLTRDNFPFDQAQPHGEDFRVFGSDGAPLAIEIERWDARAGAAAVWVRVPRIQGASRQPLTLRWGNPNARSASDAAAVFNPNNGYAKVWHLDDARTLPATDRGTSATSGQIGGARRFPGGKGLFAGDNLTDLPGKGDSHTTEAWIRAERPNATVVGWGNEQAQGKVVLQLRSPPHAAVDAYFSDANVTGRRRLPMAQWVHVVHTYAQGDARVYVDGVLDSTAAARATPLHIRRPARLWIGGWYENYDFVGDIDEVRISTVARSADWIKLEYENQKRHQTLVGTLVVPGDGFSVSPPRLTLREGERATLSATAGGALKLTWQEEGKPVATDTPTLAVDAGRTTGDRTRTIRFTARFPGGARTIDIPVTVRETIPDPVVTLSAPRRWDGRTPLEIVAATTASTLPVRVAWRVDGIATSREVRGNTLRLTRAQNSGTLTVTATVDNGGQPVVRRVTIPVREPKSDPWVTRRPDTDERPSDHQFYPRDRDGRGTLHHNGTIAAPTDQVVLRVFADDRPYATRRQKVGRDRAYRFAVPLRPGLIRYRTELVAVTAGRESLLHTASDLVCGDVFLITGQSNAVATDFGKEDPDFHSPWIRTFGTGWGEARHRGGDLAIGYWGMELARRLIEAHQVPICILNGAVGGTRIDQHQRNPQNPEDPETIYGRLLHRVHRARLTHGVRAVLWHQGENDQGADGPTGGFGWETYQAYFVDLAAAWKRDFPNVAHYYAFQIWPKSCAMGIDGSDNRLREVQRTLPALFSNLSVLSTLGIQPPGGCHFPAAGYAEFARLLCPLIERDFYGARHRDPVTPPNLRRVARTTARTVVLDFDQPVVWNENLRGEFLLDGQRGRIATGEAAGNRLTLTLTDTAPAGTITYLDSAAWSQERLLRGVNGIAALTFCEVPIGAAEKRAP